MTIILTTKDAMKHASTNDCKVSAVKDGMFSVTHGNVTIHCERAAKGSRDWNIGNTRISSQFWAIVHCVEVLTGSKF